MWKFYRELKSGKIQCTACPRLCQLNENEVGWCGARIRKEKKIEALTYGKISSLAIDPIEKKPLYHFYPGEEILSIGSFGCNMGCLHCQNWSISAERNMSKLRDLSPKDLISTALSKNLFLIASTYNEPMIAYEYVRDIGILAHKHNMKMVVVDNGYITKNLATALVPYIDAANIDIKGFTSEFYKEVCRVPSWKPILKTCEVFYRNNVHLELTNLVIPTKNDSKDMIREMCEWICDKLDTKVPLHFSRFHPDYKLRNLPTTPIKTLEMACQIAKDVGLKYVYIGNVMDHEKNNTYCHNCDHLILERSGFYRSRPKLKLNVCSLCGTKLPIVVKNIN